MERLKTITRRCVFPVMVAIILLWPAAASEAFALQAANTSTYLGNGRWHWKIFIEAGQQTLAQIACVEYTLHPTFPNPVVKVCDRYSRFALEATGWGTFVVKIRVFYKDGRIQRLEHQLVFREKKADSVSDQLRADNWSRQIGTGWWLWGIYIQGPDWLLDRVRCVEYTLHPSFPNPVRLVCSRDNRFEMQAKGWGTFKIPIKVLFKDGSVKLLEHDLHLD